MCFFLPLACRDDHQYLVIIELILLLYLLGKLARELYKDMKNEDSAVKIQKSFRRQVARKNYIGTRSSAIVLQTGIRTMVARNIFRYKAQNNVAAVIIQVITQLMIKFLKNYVLYHVYELLISNKSLQAYWRRHSAVSFYKKMKKASVLSQGIFRRKIARRHLKERKMVGTLLFCSFITPLLFLSQLLHTSHKYIQI